MLIQLMQANDARQTFLGSAKPPAMHFYRVLPPVALRLRLRPSPFPRTDWPARSLIWSICSRSWGGRICGDKRAPSVKRLLLSVVRWRYALVAVEEDRFRLNFAPSRQR